MTAGGGAVMVFRLVISLFLVDQDRHRIAVGANRKRVVPLRSGDGWILPAGSNGAAVVNIQDYVSGVFHSFVALPDGNFWRMKGQMTITRPAEPSKA